MVRKASNLVPPKKGVGSKLTLKQQSFVDAYMKTGSARQAVRDSLYNSNSPNTYAIELMQHPLIKAEIAKRREEKREQAMLSADYVLEKLQKIVEDTQEDNPQAALRGLELLGKHLGLYRDRQEISGPDGNAIELNRRTQEDASDFTSRLSRLSKSGGETVTLELVDPGSQGSS